MLTIETHKKAESFGAMLKAAEHLRQAIMQLEIAFPDDNECNWPQRLHSHARICIGHLNVIADTQLHELYGVDSEAAISELITEAKSLLESQTEAKISSLDFSTRRPLKISGRAAPIADIAS